MPVQCRTDLQYRLSSQRQRVYILLPNRTFDYYITLSSRALCGRCDPLSLAKRTASPVPVRLDALECILAPSLPHLTLR
jgi:hypothetical protein